MGELVKRRKLSGFVPIMIVVAILVGACAFMVPARAGVNKGFDQYGYNDGARVFNGWYGYYDRSIDNGWVSGTGDAMLVMKWSKDWTPMADEPIGAWCTNHWTWYSGDYDPSTWYGFNTRTPWSSDVQPTGDYMVTEFLKVQKVSEDPGMWLTYEAGGAYDAGWGTYDHWWILGDWVISVYDTYYHDIWITVQTYDMATGSFSGTGAYPAGSTTTVYYETVVGSIIGTTVTMTLTYFSDAERTLPTGYVATLMGTINAGDGSMSGTFGGGPWESTSGHAFQVPKYVVYQDTVDVFNTASGGSVAHYDLCTTAPHGLGQPIF